MSPEAQRIVIAGACGYEDPRPHSYYGHDRPVGRKDGETEYLPDYLSDLNEIHKAERQLLTSHVLCDSYVGYLFECRPPRRELKCETEKWSWGSPANQRAEVLLRTIGKWEEVPQ